MCQSLHVFLLMFLGGVVAQRANRNGQNTASSTISAAAAAISPAASARSGNASPNGRTLLAVQAGSQSNGDPKSGQSVSLTDQNNFINFCQGKTLTNGIQNAQGSCNGIVMGELPAQARMVSTVIVKPENGAKAAAANEKFDVQIKTKNLQAGVFTNPANTYYAAPQQLNSNGQVIGHAHITIQDMNANGGKDGITPPDASKFAFFKGIDDAGDGKGDLVATVANGLPAGKYRICTMMSSSNHQPVLMPVAQRGAQDDCIRITIGDITNGQGENEGSARRRGGAATSTTESVAKISATPNGEIGLRRGDREDKKVRRYYGGDDKSRKRFVARRMIL